MAGLPVAGAKKAGAKGLGTKGLPTELAALERVLAWGVAHVSGVGKLASQR